MTADGELTPVTRAPRPQAGSSRGASAPTRPRKLVSVLAVLAVAGLALAYIGPLSASSTRAEATELAPVSLYAHTIADAQAFLAASDREISLDREGVSYVVYVTPKPTPTPTPEPASGSSSTQASWSPPFVAPDPGTAQAIAYSMVLERGWGDSEFGCLVALWNRESGWRVNAYNASSGAYGIPQSLPGNKMASAGADWETNPATQISWGLGYISGRYSSPCGAWDHSESRGWY